MKYAIMSDVHANPAALEAALKDAHAQGCGRFVMLGDTTGYGYDVKTAITLVRSEFAMRIPTRPRLREFDELNALISIPRIGGNHEP